MKYWHTLPRSVLVLVLATVPACGARTGLRVVPVDAATPDDTQVTPRVPLCRPLRIRTRVGETVTARIQVDEVTPVARGFSWSLRQAPRRAMATVASPGTDTATLAPDVEGPWDLAVQTPYTALDGQPLTCPVQVLVEPADPLCPGYALVEPSLVDLPTGDVRLAFESGWSTPRRNDGREVTLVATDAPSDDVAALALDLVGAGDLAMIAGELEGRVASSVGATPVLVGREGTTAGGLRFRRSSFRVTAQPTTAGVLRDRIARDVGGLHPGALSAGFGTYATFVYEVTTVLRPEARRALVLVAAAPEPRYDDPRAPTAARLQDVTNATGVARPGQTLDVVCQRLVATRNVTADFLWLVDTSRSMDDDQERLGNTAERFFREMNAAGIDFRVGVVQAGSLAATLDLDQPGFEWIRGDAPTGPRDLAWTVTFRRFQNNAQDNLSPYPLDGQKEEPLAAGVITSAELERRMATDPGARRAFRPGAERVAFFVSDERGLNDDQRFFAMDTARWGTSPEARIRAVSAWYRDRGFLTFGMSNLFAPRQCPSIENFVPCVVTANGGAFIPLDTASDGEVTGALSRIVDAVAGAASEFVLTRPPISSTLRVRVEETLVPRSRAEGFDYDDPARAIVFRGGRFRPRRGQVVRAAYFLWR